MRRLNNIHMYTRAEITMRQQYLCTVCRVAVKNDKINCSSCRSWTHASCLGIRLEHTNVFKLSGGMFQCISCAMDDKGFDFGGSLSVDKREDV